MFLINGFKATLRQFNRDENNEIYDDSQFRDIPIKVCPYNADELIRFGIYTTSEAKGYYQVPRWVDVRQGDQILIHGRYADNNFYTVQEVYHGWLFNRMENKFISVR